MDRGFQVSSFRPLNAEALQSGIAPSEEIVKYEW